MGAWPDWWPANPIGSAYDESIKKWNWVIYLGFGLVGLLIIVYVYSLVKK